MNILDYQEVEIGATRRQQLKSKGIECRHLGEIKNNLITTSWTSIDIDLYQYERPENRGTLWLIEAVYFYPPDVQFFRTWIVDSKPAEGDIVEIVACNAQPGSYVGRQAWRQASLDQGQAQARRLG